MSEVVVFYDLHDKSRDTEKAWCIIFEDVFGYASPVKFMSKKLCTLHEKDKFLSVPCWLAFKMGLI